MMMDTFTSMKHEWFDRGIIHGYASVSPNGTFSEAYSDFECAVTSRKAHRALQTMLAFTSNALVKGAIARMMERKEHCFVRGTCPKCLRDETLCANNDPGSEIVACELCGRESSLTEVAKLTT